MGNDFLLHIYWPKHATHTPRHMMFSTHTRHIIRPLTANPSTPKWRGVTVNRRPYRPPFPADADKTCHCHLRDLNMLANSRGMSDRLRVSLRARPCDRDAGLSIGRRSARDGNDATDDAIVSKCIGVKVAGGVIRFDSFSRSLAE